MTDFQTLFQASPDAYLVVVAEEPFRIAAVNDAYLRVTMTVRENLVGQPLFGVMTDNPERPEPVGPRTLRASFQHVLASGEPHEIPPLRYDIRNRPEEGGRFVERFWRACNVPVMNPEGRITHIIHRVEDVTAFVHLQHSAEQITAERAATEARYRLVVDNLQDYAIFMLNEAGLVTHWNDGAERLLGYAAEEILGQPGAILFTPEDRARGEPEKELRTALATGSATDDRWHLRKDGSRFFVTGLMSAVTDANGHRIGLAKIMRDITDRHTAAAERDRLLESEQLARADAEHAGRLKDEFLATLSHELRTPLNAILGWTQVLKESELDPAAMAEGLEIIDRNTHVQAQLIEDLLDMSRIVSGKVRLKIEPLDFNVVVRAAIDSVRTSLDGRQIKLETQFPPGPTPLTGDRVRLQQIAWNLLSNAIKFTPPHGRIVVSVSTAGRQVFLDVEDNGTGISPDFLPHVFERFRQADASTTRAHGGLGLGLSIVKQLVELHGGEVRVESAGIGHGARFTVALPLDAPAALNETTPPAPPATSARLPACDLSGVKVLVVEDDRDSAHLVRRVLEVHRAEVRTAHSVTEALEIFPHFAPNVLLSDIGMPLQDGYELIRRIREFPTGRDVPAAAITALARAGDVDRALRAGFQTHIAKPIEPATLLRTVAELSGRPSVG